MTGCVWLVGAGPGDPDLLTRRAARVLEGADLVLYDALVDRRVLALATHAHRFPVGKRAGRPSFEQRTIEALMIRGARRGKRVVRLKAGDPFVFGRGGEEALALREAGVHVEVVPGLSSAIAAPAAAGIPVTHRGLSSGFLVLTGSPEHTWRDVLARLPPASVTLVLMMAIGARHAIATHLRAHGWAAETPVAIVFAACTGEQRVVRFDLARLAETSEDGNGAPGVIVIGAVASLGAALADVLGPSATLEAPLGTAANDECNDPTNANLSNPEPSREPTFG